MRKNLALLLSLFTLLHLNAQNKTFVIKANQPGAAISPNMYGVFFEDINMGADGGIYAELIKNRSFEFFKPLMGWKVDQKPFREGAVTVINRPQASASSNPLFLRVLLDNIQE